MLDHFKETEVPATPFQPISSLPTDPWRLIETRWDADANLLRETLFALGNGHIGTRGSHDEVWLGEAEASMEGTYVNGFYDTEAIRYPENAYGFARTNEFMLNLPNAKGIEITVDGERFNLTHGTILSYERSLDFREGVLVRTVEWQSSSGRRVSIVSKRLVSLSRSAVLAQSVAVTPLDADATVEFVATINSTVGASKRASIRVSARALPVGLFPLSRRPCRPAGPCWCRGQATAT